MIDAKVLLEELLEALPAALLPAARPDEAPPTLMEDETRRSMVLFLGLYMREMMKLGGNMADLLEEFCDAYSVSDTMEKVGGRSESCSRSMLGYTSVVRSGVSGSGRMPVYSGKGKTVTGKNASAFFE